MIFMMLMPFLMVSAQNRSSKLTPDKRLEEVFSKQELSDMLTNQPEKISYYNYFLENAYYISDIAKGPVVKITNVSLRNNFSVFFKEDVNAISPKTFNYLKYNFKIDNNHFISYSLENGKYLVFYPKNETEAKYNSINTK